MADSSKRTVLKSTLEREARFLAQLTKGGTDTRRPVRWKRGSAFFFFSYDECNDVWAVVTALSEEQGAASPS